jgi:NTE family protein
VGGLFASIRRLTGRAAPPLGLVLGGGAVRGAAHLGVLSVLEARGLRPSCIAGTSVGALVGACYAAGHSVDSLLDAFRGLSWFGVARPSLRLSIEALLDPGPLERFLREQLDQKRFSDLGVPFAAVACDLLSGERVDLVRGDVERAVLASSALPGVFPPVEIDGRILVDGALVANLPVATVRALGAEAVIAVDVATLATDEGPHSFIDTWQRSLAIMMRANQPRPEDIELYIEPPLGEFSYTAFKNVDALFDCGRRAAEEAVDRGW